MKFNLGGTGKDPDGYITVNIAVKCDISANILDLDSFIKNDGTVDEFFMRHALEHIPVDKYKSFLLDLNRKLCIGGQIKIIQTDIGKLMHRYVNGEIPFRVLRGPVFTPGYILMKNKYNQHMNMWDINTLIEDFNSIGMAAKSFDAGFWKYDLRDDMIDGYTEQYHGIPIDNLGVIATKIR